MSKLADHDIVLLVDDLGIKLNLMLVHNLIPVLYHAGACNFGMEFEASVDQDVLDNLVSAPVDDEHVARPCMFRYNVGRADNGDVKI